MKPFHSEYYRQCKDRWLAEFLEKIDFEEMAVQMQKTLEFRRDNPDWERPVVMYGIRKKHKCIKKQEIGVIMDLQPWQDRARTAETHWYKILYKRMATDTEWKEMKECNLTRRYFVWHYFINKQWSIDRIVSHIVQDDREEYGLETEQLINAFEDYYQRKIRIYRRETATQLCLFT